MLDVVVIEGFSCSFFAIRRAAASAAPPRANPKLIPLACTGLAKHGLIPAPSSREELAAFTDSENRIWGRLVKERNIKAE